MVKISMRLRLELLRRRCEGQKQYDIAKAAGIHPTTLSTLVHDVWPLKENDPRVLALGAVLGLKPEECFEPLRRGSQR
jgi:hypothetical protein